MSDGGWDDFKGPHKDKSLERKAKPRGVTKNTERVDAGGTCDWGFSRGIEDRAENGDHLVASDSSIFIPIYERYLKDKHSFDKIRTKNLSTFVGKPLKELQEWFENEGHEFTPKTTQERDNRHLCTIELPIDDQEFSVTSEAQPRKQDAVNEACLVACKLLDECKLLYSWQSNTNKEDLDRKRRLDEANKEDDIELDTTDSKKRLRTSSNPLSGSNKGTARVDTYDTLLTKWNELNMCILQLKAKLAKLDTSVSGLSRQRQQLRHEKEMTQKESELDGNKFSKTEASADEELDPLDEFMAGQDTKTKLSMNEKIEKSRMKSQIASCQKEQEEVARLLELAKPRFDLNKACLSKDNEKK